MYYMGDIIRQQARKADNLTVIFESNVESSITNMYTVRNFEVI
jgi:hypothetical protein